VNLLLPFCTDATLAKKSARKPAEDESPKTSAKKTPAKKKPVVASPIVWDEQQIESEAQRLGTYVWNHLSRRKPSMFERRWWDDRILGAAMADESLKVQMFRFVDVLPRLKTHRDVTRHLQEYFLEVKEHLPFAIEMVRFGVEHLSPDSVLSRALAYNARANAARMARRFIAGSNVNEVLTGVTALRKQLDKQKQKMAELQAAGKPTKSLEDKIYEIEDEIRLAGATGSR